MTFKGTIADVIPQWLSVKRTSMLLLSSAVILVFTAVLMWINVDNWLFRQNAILYNLPIALYCFFWLNELSRNRNTIPIYCFLIDICVVVLSITRGYSSFDVLLFSGHALFIVYAGLGWWYNRWLRYGSILILMQVAYWKFIIWNDSRSFIIGIAVAYLALTLRRHLHHSIKE